MPPTGRPRATGRGPTRPPAVPMAKSEAQRRAADPDGDLEHEEADQAAEDDAVGDPAASIVTQPTIRTSAHSRRGHEADRQGEGDDVPARPLNTK